MKLRHVRVDAVGIDLARGGCTGGGGGPQGMRVDAVGSWRLASSGVESLPRAVVRSQRIAGARWGAHACRHVLGRCASGGVHLEYPRLRR